MLSILKTGLLGSIALMLSAGLLAQGKKKVTIKAGNTIADVLTPSDIYYFLQFTNGKVYFKDGSQVEAKLNYSHLVDEMHFIDRKEDTLALTNENTIQFIVVDKDTFYYHNGYQRLLMQTRGIKLTYKQVWALGDVKKMGAFNQANTSAAITTVSTFVGKDGSYHLTLNEDLDLRRVEQFFLGDPFNRFGLASKKNVLELFAKKQQTIKIYLKKNNVDFTRKDDLEKLVRFLANL
ncbi:MAG TPA: hypothetical protein VGN63_00125 [Flavisolibacter sp.]|jgi:hypothetical protein|nr:hypothetical protein [Flavisolibacter sp.]